MLLKDKESASFLQQIENAIKRNDIVSIQHRTTAFLACYFDIIFAINEIFHPGEKRLIKFVKTRCKIIPEKFEENLEKLFNAKNNEKVEILNDMVINLKKILPDMTKQFDD